ncbi:universal stress protein [Marinobacterium rhizophilum]|uniref:universal stress protein n=1 Tax=Marinobacterium rhizophilum TaxID=420402 RepID=UPI000364959F|nr:universal stress protein [Marinobacterium rhizophilum]
MLPEFKTILYCTDLSKNASFAFRYAAYLAKQTGADIHVLHIVEKLSSDAYFALQTYVQNEVSREDFLHHRIEHARKLLEERQNYFWNVLEPREQSLRSKIVSIDIVESEPAKTILKKSKALNCDLIVMGAHEKGRIMHSFLGSVAKSVLRHSRIPTLVVPLPDKGEAHPSAVE